MQENFHKLVFRLYDSISKTDLDYIMDELKKIDSPTLVSGVGGSAVVSNFLAKVLEAKNNIIVNTVTPRDLIYKNLDGYDNIIACSYSGTNYGVDTSFNNNLNKYLLSMNNKEVVTNLIYQVADKEKSFISLASTLIPMAISLLYYSDNDKFLLDEIINSNFEFSFKDNLIYEIMGGYETSTAALFLDSTLTESGIAIPLIHDKYDYCHGRSTISFNNNNNLIFFNHNTELDRVLLEELKPYYSEIIKINHKYNDHIINDFYFTYLSMYLAKYIAEQKGKDLSNVQYSPVVKKLYKYRGEM